MSGVVFIICIPTEEFENSLPKKKRVTIEEGPLENRGQQKVELQSMQKILQNILLQLKISNATWCSGLDGDQPLNYYKIVFSLDTPDRCEEILELLKANNIGKRFNSSVSVIPCTIHYHGSEDPVETTDSKGLEENFIQDSPEKSSAWNTFVTSVKARLTVAQIVENVKVHAALTFDFLCLLLISTLLCAIGLVENSNVYLLSSMLISPMMGPVMAGTFGSVIQDKRLQKIGVQNELIGLGIATLVGFVYGSIICLITDQYGSQNWPTYEMTSRGELRTLWVGCLIALLSGAAVALGILSDNIASLVGVAISTSLMPPAVNAGLLWSLASIYYLKGNDTNRYVSLTHTKIYSEDEAIELLYLGGLSLCLTFINIICIYVAAVLVFRIKEVAPMPSKDPTRRQFWRYDIKIARDYNKTLQKEEASDLYKNFCNEHSNLSEIKSSKDQLFHSTDLSKNSFKINSRRPEYTWSPCMDLSPKDLKDLYQNFWKSKMSVKKHPSIQREHRSLSQIFASTKSEETERLITIREHSPEVPSTSQIRGSHKTFIVTPCTSDPLKPNL